MSYDLTKHAKKVSTATKRALYETPFEVAQECKDDHGRPQFAVRTEEPTSEAHMLRVVLHEPPRDKGYAMRLYKTPEPTSLRSDRPKRSNEIAHLEGHVRKRRPVARTIAGWAFEILGYEYVTMSSL